MVLRILAGTAHSLYRVVLVELFWILLSLLCKLHHTIITGVWYHLGVDNVIN